MISQIRKNDMIIAHPPCIVKLRKKRGVLFIRGCNVKIHCTVFQHNPLYIQNKADNSYHSTVTH